MAAPAPVPVFYGAARSRWEHDDSYQACQDAYNALTVAERQILVDDQEPQHVRDVAKRMFAWLTANRPGCNRSVGAIIRKFTGIPGVPRGDRAVNHMRNLRNQARIAAQQATQAAQDADQRALHSNQAAQEADQCAQQATQNAQDADQRALHSNQAAQDADLRASLSTQAEQRATQAAKEAVDQQVALEREAQQAQQQTQKAQQEAQQAKEARRASQKETEKVQSDGRKVAASMAQQFKLMTLQNLRMFQQCEKLSQPGLLDAEMTEILITMTPQPMVNSQTPDSPSSSSSTGSSEPIRNLLAAFNATSTTAMLRDRSRSPVR